MCIVCARVRASEAHDDALEQLLGEIERRREQRVAQRLLLPTALAKLLPAAHAKQ